MIGIEVFARGIAYSPQEDPIVRIMAGRLRSKLVEYYQDDGAGDPVVIEIPRGGYSARFTWNSLTQTTGALPPDHRPARPAQRRSIGRIKNEPLSDLPEVVVEWLVKIDGVRLVALWNWIIQYVPNGGEGQIKGAAVG